MFTACRTQQLTMPLCVTLLCSSQIHPVAIFQTWPSFGQNSGQLSFVGLVAFHHRFNRNHKNQSPPFALCTYARLINYPSCSRACKRQRLVPWSWADDRWQSSLHVL